MNLQRSIQRTVHTVDNIGGRDLPHLSVHLEDAQKARTLAQAKEHVTRAQGHVSEAVHQSGMLSEAIKAFPGVQHEAQRLATVRNQSDGLTDNKGGKMASTINTKKTGTFQGKSNAVGGGGRFAQMTAKGVSPGLAAFIGRKKFGASRMSKMAAAGKKG